MRAFKQIFSFLCGEPQSIREPNSSEQIVDQSSSSLPRTFSPRSPNKRYSSNSHQSRALSQTIWSIPSPTLASRAAVRKNLKKHWRLSDREVVPDGHGGQVLVREIVLQSPITPTHSSASLQSELPIYAAHMRSSGHHIKDVQGENMEGHVNPGHNALDLLARMSSTNRDSRPPREQYGMVRPISFCAAGSQKQSLVCFARPLILGGQFHPRDVDDMENSSFIAKETKDDRTDRSQSESDFHQNSACDDGPFESAGSDVLSALQSAPSESALQTVHLDPPDDKPETRPTTADSLVDAANHSPPSSPTNSYDMVRESSSPYSCGSLTSDASSVATPEKDAEDPSQDAHARNDQLGSACSTRTSYTWRNLPPVFERLYEDALRREQRRQQPPHAALVDAL